MKGPKRVRELCKCGREFTKLGNNKRTSCYKCHPRPKRIPRYSRFANMPKGYTVGC